MKCCKIIFGYIVGLWVDGKFRVIWLYLGVFSRFFSLNCLNVFSWFFFYGCLECGWFNCDVFGEIIK